jgi:hypothetical protein
VIALVDGVGLDRVETYEQVGQLRWLRRRAVGLFFGPATPASEVDLRPGISYA